jgi:Transposase DDE domain/Transposase DNA-binding
MFTSFALSLRPHSIFGHKKTNNRFVSLINTLGSGFGHSINSSCDSTAESSAIYHFMNSPRVNHESIILSERDRLLGFVSSLPDDTILSISDVTTLQYTTKRSSAKMKYVTSKNQHGYQVISQMLCHQSGAPIGILSQYCWNYEIEDLGQRRQRQNLSIEEKETGYYLRQVKHLQEHFGEQPSKKIIHLIDRAGDVHEILQSRPFEHIHYIIRSKNDRKLLDEDKTIRQLLDTQPVVGCYTILMRTKVELPDNVLKIEKQRAEKGDWREAKVEVSFAKATLRATNISANRKLVPIDAYIVRVKEKDCPEGVEPIEWVLLTTLKVENLEDAFQVIDYYILRWQIEVFHHILKQGAKIEELQLEEPRAILNALAVYSILSVQILRLRDLAEKDPDQPLETAGYTEKDYQIIATYLNSKAQHQIEVYPPKSTISDFIRLVSMLGGNRKGKKIGVDSLWKGLRDFGIIRDAYWAFAQTDQSPPNA